MRKPIKDVFLDIIEEWDEGWKDQVDLYNFVTDYIEINDDLHSYVIKKKKHMVELE